MWQRTGAFYRPFMVHFTAHYMDLHVKDAKYNYSTEKSSTKSTHVARLKALPWRRIGMFLLISPKNALAQHYTCLLAIFSHFSTGQSDHSLIVQCSFGCRGISIRSLKQTIGWDATALWSHNFLVFKWLGIGALLLPNVYGAFLLQLISPSKAPGSAPYTATVALLTMLWVEVLFGYFSLIHPNNMLLQALCGGMGYELAHIVYKSTRSWGIGAVLLLLIAVQVLSFFYGNISLKDIFALFSEEK